MIKNMKLTTNERKINLSPNTKENIEKKFGKLDKFFSGDADCHITLSEEKGRFTVEVTIHHKGFLFRAQEEKRDLHEAIDKIIDVIERQIRKNKTKLEKRLRNVDYEIYSDSYESESGDFEEFNIVKTKVFSIKPMEIEEAILQMNMINHKFFVFKNAATEQTNVVYVRNDGNYGLIETK